MAPRTWGAEPGEIGGQGVSLHRQRDFQRYRGAAHAVAVHVVGKGVAAVGPGGDFPPKQPFGVGDHVGRAAGEGLRAVAPDELVDAPLPDVAGGDLGLHVPDGHARHPGRWF